MSALPSHLELVQGIVLPKPVGADPVLDFLNTRADWSGRGPARSEWLTGYETLVIWSGHVGLLPDATVFRLIEQASAHPTDASRRFEAALAFRADLYDVLTDTSGSAAAFERVARVIERAAGRRQLTALSNLHGVGATWELAEDLNLPLDQLAVLAGDLLTGPQRAQVRLCAGDACGWLFLDPRGRRRWCSMATCGNRSKVRAHAARTR
ncbi:putative stress-induced transcription regulator [Kribbella amoyensis]|uniref:Putative stress-induced transcription regulator n=1 Tax=Kribbella amoyensis TaxID=996641 RepID=A0A561BJZ7_9ACTN|nr:CGNR zinc finger domain-containing protein [Kribbella amoyensis]TWD79207.1 putative stress-induced transcription regulator [Kribbella amoyensis]